MSTIIYCGLFMAGMIAFAAWMLVRGGSDFEDEVTGTEAIRSPLDHGWTYQRDDVRERYESECG